MRYAIQTILIFAICGNLLADEKLVPSPDPISEKLIEVRLPTVPITRQPDDPAPLPPTPVPPNNKPVLVSDINEGELYVIEHPSELLITSSPEGFLTITQQRGPLNLYARFVDGVDRSKYEKRSYFSDFVYVVTANKTGNPELLIITGLDQPIVRNYLKVTIGPRPPPIPDPVDPVDPTPDPVDPITPTKLQVVIIEDPELKSTLPPDQLAAMDGFEVRQYVKTHCSMTGDTPDFRKLSIRQNISNAPAWIKTAFAEQRTALPFIVILTPTQTISGPLPKTVEETLTLLKKYGGE